MNSLYWPWILKNSDHVLYWPFFDTEGNFNEICDVWDGKGRAGRRWRRCCQSSRVRRRSRVFGKRRGGVVVIGHGGHMERLSAGIREDRKSNCGWRGWLRGKKRPTMVEIGLGFWISIPDAYWYHVRIKKRLYNCNGALGGCCLYNVHSQCGFTYILFTKNLLISESTFIGIF